MPTLRVIEPGRPPRALDADGDVITIGAERNNHIVIADAGADPNHCALERAADGSYRLVDLASTKGTLLNGRPVKSAPIAAHDEVLVGSTRIVIESLGAARTDVKPRALRRRRRVAGRRRRIVLPARTSSAKVFSFEDLKVVIESLIEEQGMTTLDRIGELVDEYHEEYRGTRLLAYLRGEVEALYRLIEISKHLTQEHDPRKLLDLILDGMIEITGAERGFIILRGDSELDVRAARNIDQEEIDKPEFKISRTIAEQVMTQGRALISMDALNDPNIPAAQSVEQLQLRSLACIPLRIAERVVGCVYLDNRFEAAVFMQSDLPLLEAFAEQAAVALENARLHQEILSKSRELEASHAELDRLNELLKQRVQVQYDEMKKIRTELLSTKPFKYEYKEIIGDSLAMRDVLLLLDRVIDSDENVFVYGESGTGKELVARAIHSHSRRKAGPFIGENCSAIPETLLESELFGHEKGAFTGAGAQKKGLFELASGGTLFLDEIGDMPVEMQKKLLRAIQEGVIRRVGGKDPVQVNVRVVSASNKDLKELIKQNLFREDLFYRLNVVQINLPPLRDRREDIPLLAEHFLTRIAEEQKAPKRTIDDAAVWAMMHYDWPGNVRELENEVRRAVALSDEAISVDDLKEDVRRSHIVVPGVRLRPASRLKEIVDRAIEDIEGRVIQQVMDEVDWKKVEAARILGISRPTLDAKLERYRIEKPAVRKP